MKVMLLGKIGCGKTTLTQRLNEQDVVYAKTQAAYTVLRDYRNCRLGKFGLDR